MSDAIELRVYMGGGAKCPRVSVGVELRSCEATSPRRNATTPCTAGRTKPVRI
jgi:hypothetical protein